MKVGIERGKEYHQELYYLEAHTCTYYLEQTHVLGTYLRTLSLFNDKPPNNMSSIRIMVNVTSAFLKVIFQTKLVRRNCVIQNCILQRNSVRP